jgi:hypothetical protein
MTLSVNFKEVLGDGNCLLHSILLATSQIYQNADVHHRHLLARQLRHQIAVYLLSYDPKNPNYIYWETHNNLGFLSNLFLDIEDVFFNYSPHGLYEFFSNTNISIGDEAYAALADIIKCNLIIVGKISNEHWVKYYQSNWYEEYPIVTVYYQPGHYLLLTPNDEENIWPKDNLFIKSLDLDYNNTKINERNFSIEYKEQVEELAVNNVINLDNLKQIHNLPPWSIILIHLRETCKDLQSQFTIVGNLYGNLNLEKSLFQHIEDKSLLEQLYIMLENEKDFTKQTLWYFINQDKVKYQIYYDILAKQYL